jgi:hypothetical protein
MRAVAVVQKVVGVAIIFRDTDDDARRRLSLATPNNDRVRSSFHSGHPGLDPMGTKISAARAKAVVRGHFSSSPGLTR